MSKIHQKYQKTVGVNCHRGFVGKLMSKTVEMAKFQILVQNLPHRGRKAKISTNIFVYTSKGVAVKVQQKVCQNC